MKLSTKRDFFSYPVSLKTNIFFYFDSSKNLFLGWLKIYFLSVLYFMLCDVECSHNHCYTEGYNLLLTISIFCWTNPSFTSHPCTGCQHTAPVLYLGFAQEELKFRHIRESYVQPTRGLRNSAHIYWDAYLRWALAESQATGLALG